MVLGYDTGTGYGSGSGYGHGSVHGSGFGNGYGYGDGYGYVDGYGSGSGYGSDYGYGYVDGYGYGEGIGIGIGNGSGYGYGYGYGYGSGSGYGDGDEEYWQLAVFPARHALDLPDAELRRVAIERIGPDRFFTELEAVVVHQDIDGVGNRRRLLRVRVEDAEAGYLQAVEVVCPTTGRVYHLGVMPDVTTCQDAVASTFGMSGSEYSPVRET